MERTIENIQYCGNLVKRFLSIRRERPIDKADVDLCLDALADTLVKACSKPEVAAIIVDAVLDGEERWPSVGTIRRYMRELQYVEMDVREREDKRMREEQARRKAEDASRGTLCPPDIARRMDRLYVQLCSDELKAFGEEFQAACDDETAREILTKYETLFLPTNSQIQ